MQATQRLRFSRKDSKEFFKTLNKRVNHYFKENKIEKQGIETLPQNICDVFLAHSSIRFGTHAEHQSLDQIVTLYRHGCWNGWCRYECHA